LDLKSEVGNAGVTLGPMQEGLAIFVTALQHKNRRRDAGATKP
jgi:hypothetical protein